MGWIEVSGLSIFKLAFLVLLIAGVILPDIRRIVAKIRCALSRDRLVPERPEVLSACHITILIRDYPRTPDRIKIRIPNSAIRGRVVFYLRNPLTRMIQYK
jgi:hypothetical protein